MLQALALTGTGFFLGVVFTFMWLYRAANTTIDRFRSGIDEILEHTDIDERVEAELKRLRSRF